MRFEVGTNDNISLVDQSEVEIRERGGQDSSELCAANIRSGISCEVCWKDMNLNRIACICGYVCNKAGRGEGNERSVKVFEFFWDQMRD